MIRAFKFRDSQGRNLYVEAEFDGHKVLGISAWIDVGDHELADEMFDQLPPLDQRRIAAAIEDSWLADHDCH